MSAYNDLTKLILWCRKNGVSWNTLTVGAISIDGADLRGTEALPVTRPESAPRENIYTRYGAAILKEAGESKGMTSVVEEED